MDVVDRGQFSIIDYICFAFVLFFSAVIGFYHGAKSRKSASTKDDYLLGGRDMGLLPVTCSLVATVTSGMTIVGLSAEAYAHGIHTWMLSVTLLVSNTVFLHVFIPVLYELKVASSFEYLEMRFSRSVRVFASGVYTVAGLVYLPVTVYVPALVFNKVTGVNIYATVIALSILCASYTAVGGFKAVVWTDVLQLILMVVSTIIVATVGAISVGGFENIWDAAERGERLNWINFSDFGSRTVIWAYVNSSLINIYQFGLNQTCLQRFLALSSLKKVKIASWIVVIAFGCFIFMAQFIGVIMYASYETCDPFTQGIIQKLDQILPHFIQEKASIFTGFNGIFIAGIFAASLSTTSSYLNALGGTIYEDFLSYRFANIEERTAKKILKAIVLILGAVQVLMVTVVQKMGMIYKITNQTMTLSTSTIFGFFVAGVLLPKVNGKGAQTGACVGGIVLTVLIIGGMANKPEPTLPLSTDGCSSQKDALQFSNSTIIANEKVISEASDDWRRIKGATVCLQPHSDYI
ncbi:sodium-coupled monocarboxylate transporter 1-like [Phlebotomus argentipes]|uniref:sodium-coupled monocarboxylate transporter 1-like n=1 Tax=Phlebotomus argentipes TaxID=94469 RepID=UPI0028933AD5|nr:sodium-coupled monocarboxylate transporter 1-like [Phlebotomus argentipes]